VVSATKRGVVAAVLGLTMLAAAACDSATAGQPEPKETSSESTSESTAESTSESEEPDSDYSLASLCGLLTPEEATQLGGSSAGEQGNSIGDGHAICTWKDQTSLVVGYQTGTSTAEADTGPGITNTPTTIDGLPAVQSLSTDTVVICEILVDLPSGKMVAASATVLSAGEGKYDQCQVANQLANLIIPRVKDQ
jgi:hypothetical protein